MFRAAALLAVFTSLAWTQTDPVRQTTAAMILAPLPEFRNGYLYSLPMPGGSALSVFAPDGKIHTILIGHRDAMSAAVDADGTLAIGWVELPKIGIDIRHLDGSLIHSIDTGRYMPSHLAFGRDHSLWSFGWQRDADDLYKADKQDYSTVRHYSTDGKPSGAFMPRSQFPAGLLFQASHISVTADRVGLDADSGTHHWQREWVELDLSGDLIGRWRQDRDADFVRGVFLTDDDEAYVGLTNPKDESYTVWKLDRATRNWDKITLPDTKQFGWLYGVDGDQLVFANWPDGQLHLSWFAQPGSSLSASKAHN